MRGHCLELARALPRDKKNTRTDECAVGSLSDHATFLRSAHASPSCLRFVTKLVVFLMLVARLRFETPTFLVAVGVYCAPAIVAGCTIREAIELQDVIVLRRRC